MPVIDFIQDDFSKIVTWNVSESREQMLAHLNLDPSRLKKLETLRPKQAKEYLGLRACLLELNSDLEMYYDDLGKPYLLSDKHLSITHSYENVSVAISQYNIGIDIERKRDKKIKNIAEKFVRADEDSWIPKDETYVDFLHIIWGIKEGLYKINGGNLWNFLHHYKVAPFQLKENSEISCLITDSESQQKFKAYYKTLGTYYLIWVVEY